MGIEQEHVGGRYGPIIACDECGGRVRNADGNVYWRHDEERPAALEGPLIIHKASSSAFEHKHRGDEMWLTAELDVWLVWALENAGYGVNDAKGRADVTSVLE